MDLIDVHEIYVTTETKIYNFIGNIQKHRKHNSYHYIKHFHRLGNGVLSFFFFLYCHMLNQTSNKMYTDLEKINYICFFIDIMFLYAEDL